MYGSVIGLLLTGCTPADETSEDANFIYRDDTDTAGTDSGGDTGGEDTAEGDTGSSLKQVDCDEPLLAPSDLEVLPVYGARGYHGLVFDSEGHIIGNHNNALYQADSSGQSGVFIPNMGTLDQMDYLPNGDLVVASRTTGEIRRFTSEGGMTILASGLWSYGLMLGPDEMLYTANNQRVYRIDPDTGESEILVDNVLSGGVPRVINFSPDLSRLYIGTLSNAGRVFYLPLDEDLNPAGEPELFAVGVGGGYHDGLGVDVCGNLYIPDYTSRSLYRVSHEGEVELLWASAILTQYPHGVSWGTGRDGWDDLSIYLPQPYNDNTVVQIDLQIPYRTWEGTVLNAPWMK